ncbi:TPA: single-stranded DNA-binding protein [Legionella pneumophila subsp. pneumophila]|uniref:Single-stranded DNA-binding protein n=1 Tax=Legionella pneumophila TaxID=446 RepID=A0A2S6FA69_LEGPN|nr:Single-stranded DNA-binding protein [Legionella pneumophila subsp. pneumophila LPE509]OOD08340.1 single-stranded DNA-binding protein [Legionella pneumophila subsp. pneumophila ATCC 43290]PPK27971.1 single-stranded DNA-binding protein [Legionella pneumophila]HAT8835053.1 single-stranded DNA-binding protein [Legionella pneumophila subsp. pneumophila]PPK34318.1 single-stranded DNA-binding protein [Legionella pneumophila]
MQSLYSPVVFNLSRITEKHPHRQVVFCYADKTFITSINKRFVEYRTV